MEWVEHHKFEMSETVHARLHHAFQRVSIVRSTGLLKGILYTGIYPYSSALLAVELSKAEILCFSADLRLTVGILD